MKHSILINLYSTIARVIVVSLLYCGLFNSASADSIDDFVEAELTRQQVPGVSIGIFKQGKPVRMQGYGLANVEHGVRVHPDTLFLSASVTKMFTAMGIMLLVDDGKLDLDTSIRHYLPDAPRAWQSITLRHLLTHTSGVARDFPDDIDIQKEYSEDEMLKIIYAQKLRFPVGRRYAYSNLGYVTLGIIIHKISGQFYADFLDKRVFKPLNMPTARVITDDSIIMNRASGYELIDNVLKNNHEQRVSFSLGSVASGALYQTMLDFSAWDAAVHSRALLKPESWQQILSPVSLDNGSTYPYGFGWEFDKAPNGDAIIGHDGLWQGVATDYRRYDDDGVSFVVFANSDDANPHAILQGIAQRFDARYTKKEEDTPEIIDERIDLTKYVEYLVKKLRENNISKKDFPNFFDKGFRNEYKERMQNNLQQAGLCKLLVLTFNEPNGDILTRRYKLDCANKELSLYIVFDEKNKVLKFRLWTVEE